MNKIVKRKLIGSILCIIISIGVVVYCMINGDKIGEDLNSYLNGFSTGLVVVGICFFVSAIRAIRNPKIAKNLENIKQDERLNSILARSMAITFRISIFIQSIVSVVSAILGYMYIAEILGLIVGLQVILYVVVYLIVSYKS